MNIEQIKEKLKTNEYDFLRGDKNLGDNVILLTLGGSHAYGWIKKIRRMNQMEIYDYSDLGNMRSLDYLMNNRNPRDDGIEPITITDKELEMGELLIINNVAYTICALSSKGNKFQIAYVERVKNQSVFVDGEDPEDQYGTDNITCPYCGYENVNSWESNELNEHYECPHCGSYFSYEREVRVSYHTRKSIL